MRLPTWHEFIDQEFSFFGWQDRLMRRVAAYPRRVIRYPAWRSACQSQEDNRGGATLIQCPKTQLFPRITGKHLCVVGHGLSLAISERSSDGGTCITAF